MTNAFTGSVVEQAALAWLESAGWRVAYMTTLKSILS